MGNELRALIIEHASYYYTWLNENKCRIIYTPQVYKPFCLTQNGAMFSRAINIVSYRTVQELQFSVKY